MKQFIFLPPDGVNDVSILNYSLRIAVNNAGGYLRVSVCYSVVVHLGVKLRQMDIKSVCVGTFGCLWWYNWLSVVVHLVVCGGTFGCLWGYIWLSVVVLLGVCGGTFGCLWWYI